MLSKNKFLSLILALLLIFNVNSPLLFAAEQAPAVENKTDIQAVEARKPKYPNYADMYVGEDKYEGFNRKMFNLNSKLNKFVARPVHILWASVMPKYGMDRLQSAYNNIEYPKRLASCLLQKDGEGVKNETLRFLTNTTIGLGGLFDPADKLFKIKPTSENMEQALCKCKMKPGPYLVAPVLNACTPRSLCGRALEAALDPSVYLGTPVTAIVKFGLMVNRTSYMQPLAKMIESTYADPYDIQKKLYGIENYIKNSNLDRKDLLQTEAELVEEGQSALAEEMIAQLGDEAAPIEDPTPTPTLPEGEGAMQPPLTMTDEYITGAASALEDLEIIKKEPIKPDIVLSDYNPQCPVVDSMRTALFDDPSINKSIWNELSIWNRSFAKRIKTGSVSVVPEREAYKYRYILQKDKNAPLVILYPSIGEGATTHHSTIFAKMFYDEGYSVIMQGSHFHWEFVKSMPQGYCPGVPAVDADNIKLVTSKIIDSLEKKYERKFDEKVVVGTSFGAMATLFLADKESKNNTLNISRFIAVSPPIELTYALEQLDKNADEFDKNSPEVKHKTAVTAAKILQLVKLKDSPEFEIGALPFSEEEGKLITTFILRQKLSDLIFTIENVAKGQKTDIYDAINNTSYRDYAEKYLLKNGELTMDDLQYETSLFSLSDYLANNDNYRIYHSLDDYFTNKSQIERLKTFSGSRLTCLDCGAHLGFLYRKEFIESLKADIASKM